MQTALAGCSKLATKALPGLDYSSLKLDSARRSIRLDSSTEDWIGHSIE